MSWPTVTLGSIVELERDGAEPSTLPLDTRYVGLEHIDSDGMVNSDATVGTEKLKSTKFRFNEGHILYGKLRPYLRKIVRPDFAGVCSTDIIPIRPTAVIDRGYLFYVLRSPEMVGLATSRCTGANLPRLNPSQLEAFEVPLPPLPEQKRIAAILDAADALRAKRRESIEQLDSLVQATFLEMFGDPVTNPKGWERRTLGEIIRFVGGSQPPKTTFTYEPSPETVRLVQIRDFKTDEYKTYIPSNLARRRFSSDDVMIARYGPPVFQILRGLEGTYNVALMKADPKEGILKQFIFFLLSHPSVNRAVVAKSGRTAGQSGVNLDFLNNFPAYRPPLALQNRFASIVESIEQQKARLKAHLAELDTLFASLQSRAFNGELVA